MERKLPGAKKPPEKKKEEGTDLTPPPAKEKKKPVGNIYGNLDMDDDIIDEEEADLDDGLDDEFRDEGMSAKTKGLIAAAVVGLIGLAVAAFMFFNKEEPPPPPAEEPVEEVDPTLQALDDLYKLGIGKEAISEERIYEQGTLDSQDFRKDFTNQSASETYAEPVEIMTVNDSVSYVKHRTMTDDGIDVYWVDAVYKEKDTTFTVPYYIWRTLAEEGVMDVVVEVVTDANDKVFIASITARPPAEE